MKTESLNLFILDDNTSTVAELKNYLLDRFGKGIRILTFNNSKNCLENIDEYTNIVVLNSHIKGENNVQVLRSIKETNPKTEIIVLSEKKDIASAIEVYRAGAKGLVIKGRGLGKSTGDWVIRIFTAPIRIIERELGLSERIAVFIMSFLTLAIIVVLYFIFINRVLV